MPARQHDSFKPPNDPDARIWRYIDLSKLVSFLMSGSLHLTKLSDLDDEFEGRLPPHAIPGINAEYARTERVAERDPGPDPRYAEGVMELVRASTYVNCWCCHQHESEALWRLYGHPAGVALRTTFSTLASALPEACFLGRVQYLDYAVSAPSPDNSFNLASHKRVFFSHEHEVRIVMSAMPLRWPAMSEETAGTPPFFTQPVEFSAFEEIVVSPYAPRWFLPLVRDLAKRYACTIPVRDSGMICQS